jgi:SAM-dependent methyltransferase
MSSDVKARRDLEQRVYWDVISRSPDSKFQVIVKMLRDPNFAQSVVRKHLYFGRPKALPLLTTDRLVLQHQVFPYYQSSASIRDVLFVGCDADTARYERDYFSKVRFVTIEPNPDNRCFGAIHHVESTLEELGRHFSTESFDLIVCNGVFGWGLDDFEKCEMAIEQCHACLRPNGHLVLGWNDVPRRTPFPLETLTSLAKFRKFDFPPLGSWRFLTDTVYRHTFDFYLK